MSAFAAEAFAAEAFTVVPAFAGQASAGEALAKQAFAAVVVAIAAELVLIAEEAKTRVAVTVAITVAEYTQVAFLIAPRTLLAATAMLDY